MGISMCYWDAETELPPAPFEGTQHALAMDAAGVRRTSIVCGHYLVADSTKSIEPSGAGSSCAGANIVQQLLARRTHYLTR